MLGAEEVGWGAGPAMLDEKVPLTQGSWLGLQGSSWRDTPRGLGHTRLRAEVLCRVQVGVPQGLTTNEILQGKQDHLLLPLRKWEFREGR